MELRDGKGRGYLAEVNEDQNLVVDARVAPALARNSRFKSEAYSWTAVSADIDTGDTALLVCNTSTTKRLYIGFVYLWADTAVQFKIHLPAYPTLTGTLVTGNCLNRAVKKTAEALAYADETGNVFAAGNVILTMRNNEVGTDQFGVDHNFEGSVVLGYHDSIAVDLIGETAAFECSIFGYYESF